MLTVGSADANPTTILEAMAWGLIPICTPTSGYMGIPSIPNVPVGNAATAAATVRRLLHVDESELVAMQTENGDCSRSTIRGIDSPVRLSRPSNPGIATSAAGVHRSATSIQLLRPHFAIQPRGTSVVEGRAAMETVPRFPNHGPMTSGVKKRV